MRWLATYAATIVAANWLVSRFGIVSIWGTPWSAPAGVYAAGLAFTCRDMVQRSLGRRWTVAAIVAGAGLSALLSPTLALASGVAFLASEVLDMTVYTPLAARGRWYAAVGLSNTVGAVVDSVLFLSLAFGSLAFLPGQVAGKLLMVIPVLAVFGGHQAVRRWARLAYPGRGANA